MRAPRAPRATRALAARPPQCAPVAPAVRRDLHAILLSPRAPHVPVAAAGGYASLFMLRAEVGLSNDGLQCWLCRATPTGGCETPLSDATARDADAPDAAPLALPKKIQAAAAAGKAGVVQTWLAGDGRVDATCVNRGVSGCTLLLIAAEHGHKELVELLLKRGAEADARDSGGGTALMVAAAKGHERVAEMLLRHGAGISLQDREGGNALMSAAAKGHERVVEMLIQHGAEINLQDSDGHTALMFATRYGHPAVVLRLLRTGADMTLRTEEGKTALQIAKEEGHTECVEAFRTYLGEVAGRREAAAAEASGAGGTGAPKVEAAAGASAAASASSGEGGAEAELSARRGQSMRRGPGADAFNRDMQSAAHIPLKKSVSSWTTLGMRVEPPTSTRGLPACQVVAASAGRLQGARAGEGAGEG